ncbi:DMT family transporter [Motiliproteus sp.]|uniref:DMT family transporter n=1 Tax=Motiliproteus sp. TaxID=1898955 RepID=UPI003BA9989E
MERYLPQLLLVLTTLFWSGNFVVARLMHQSMPPLSLSFWRWMLALLILLPWVWPKMRAEQVQLRRHWRLLLLLAVLGVANFNSFVYIGLQSTTATNATLLQSVLPATVVALSVLLLGIRIRPLQLVGLLLSLSGVACIVLQGRLEQLAALQFNRGDLWILAAMLSWATYTVALRWRPETISALALLGSTVAIGALVILPFYLWELLVQGRGFELVPGNLATLGYVALFPSVLAYFFWNYGVARLGAARAGLYINLMPIFGMGLSILFLDEQPEGYHLLGLTLVLGGILLASRTGAESR